MRKEATFLGLTICVICVTGAAIAQTNNSTPSIDTPTRSNARDNHPDPPTRVNADDISEVEALRRRVDQVEEQHRALGLLLQELKSRLKSVQPSDVASNSQLSKSTAQEGGTPVAPSPSKQIDSGNVRWADLIGEGNRFKLYGFIRLDVIFDSQQPNNAQTILFIKSPDPRTGNDNGDFAMHPRLTRFGIDYSGPRIAKLGDAKLTGKLETDFQNGGTESRQIIRVRHAYLRLDWKDTSLLAGQTWDTFSPLFPTVNADTLQWNAGNLGDRRPQLRVAYEPKVSDGKFSFTGGIGLTGAIDALDLDANGVRDGEESARPNVQVRVGFSHPLGSKDRSASVGVSGFYGFLKSARTVAGRTEFLSQAVDIDFMLPITSHLALKGEGWWGRNMSDVRGGAGQGVNPATGRAIRGRGGWAEANFNISRYLSINPGVSTDDPVNKDLFAGGRTRNGAFFIANRITPGGNFVLGADYLRWRTDFKGFLKGINNRVNIFFQYNF